MRRTDTLRRRNLARWPQGKACALHIACRFASPAVVGLIMQAVEVRAPPLERAWTCGRVRSSPSWRGWMR